MKRANSPRRIGPLTMIPRGKFWHCRFQIQGCRFTRTTGVPLKHLARAEAAAREIHKNALLRFSGEEPCPTLQKAFELWEETCLLSKSPSHIQNAARMGRLHLGSLKNILLKDLTTAKIEDERAAFLKAGHSKSYANQWLAYIRIVCKWAVRRKMIRAVLFEVSEIPIQQEAKTIIPTEKAAEWLREVRILSTHEPAIAMVLRLMIGLGLRGGEARNARWEWLDLERGTYTPGMTKGKKAVPRAVPPWILAELRPIAQSFGWMVPGSRGNPLTYGRIKRVFDAACKKCNISKMSPHRLRATYATWLSEAGVPIQDIQAALEHKDIRTTAIYLGQNLDRVSRAQEQIAARAGLW